MTTKAFRYTRCNHNTKHPPRANFSIGAQQFDVSNRCALAMTAYCKNRGVTKNDVSNIGYFDLQKGNKEKVSA